MNKSAQSVGIIILKQVEKHDWIFDYPRITDEALDLLDEAIDWMHIDVRIAKLRFKRLINEYPEFLDVYHHLALTWYRQGKKKKAAELWKHGIEFALRLFPANFSIKKDQLIWGLIKNRPFLRLYHSYGISLMEQGEPEKALDVFENLLSLNPNDNQGARALVVECCFDLKRPERVLKICNQYRPDILPEIIFGRVLALFQLGKIKEASKSLKLAHKNLPLITQELAKTMHKKPIDYNEQRITLGSQNQAYCYWKEHGKRWVTTPGAIEFVRSHFEKD